LSTFLNTLKRNSPNSVLMRQKVLLIKGFILFILTANATTGISQEKIINQAKLDIKALSSEKFEGRGYDNEGHLKAARFIKERFKSLDAKPVSKEWFQSFNVSVNNINQSELIINDIPLKPGIDFIPHATTGSGEGVEITNIKYAEQGLFIPDIGVNQLPINSAENAILVMDNQFPDSLRQHRAENPTFYSKSYRIQAAKALKAQALIFLSSKLNHSVPFFHYSLPVLEVREQAWPLKLDKISYKITSRFDTVTTQNVMAEIPGTSKPDSIILLSAHYDHFGSIAPGIYFPGANDNASGVAMLFSIAEYFAANPVDYTLLFVAFGAEELGLKGSDYFLENPPVPLENIKFVINFDMVASGTEGIVAVGGKKYPSYYTKLEELNQSLLLGPIRARGNSPNSDHFRFLERGIPGFYLYTNQGKQLYHHVNDTSESLDWEEYYDVFKLSAGYIESMGK